MGEMPAILVIAVEAAVVGNFAESRSTSFPVFQQRNDIVAGEAGLPGGVQDHTGELAGPAVEEVQAAVIGTHPEMAFVVFEGLLDEIRADGMRVGGVELVSGECSFGFIEQIQAAAPGGDPQCAFAVLHHIEDGVGAEAFIVEGIIGVMTEGLAVTVEQIEAARRPFRSPRCRHRRRCLRRRSGHRYS